MALWGVDTAAALTCCHISAGGAGRDGACALVVGGGAVGSSGGVARMSGCVFGGVDSAGGGGRGDGDVWVVGPEGTRWVVRVQFAL